MRIDENTMNTIYAFCDASFIKHYERKDINKKKSKSNRTEAFCLGMVAFQFNLVDKPGEPIKKAKSVKVKSSHGAEILAIIETIKSINNHYNRTMRVQIYSDQLHLIEFIENDTLPKRKKNIQYIKMLKEYIKTSHHNISLNWVKSHVKQTERNVFHVLHHETDRLAYSKNRARAKQLRKIGKIGNNGLQ